MRQQRMPIAIQERNVQPIPATWGMASGTVRSDSLPTASSAAVCSC